MEQLTTEQKRKILLKSKGHTLEQVAELLKISRSTLYNHIQKIELDSDFIQNVQDRLGINLLDGTNEFDKAPNRRLSQVVRAMKQSEGLTTDALALRLGLTGNDFAELFTGVQPLTLDTAYKLFLNAHINPEWVLFGKGDMFLKKGPSEQSKNLQILLTHLNLPANVFAQEIGVEEEIISNILNDHNSLTEDVINNIRTRFPYVNYSWIAYGSGEMIDTWVREEETVLDRTPAREEQKTGHHPALPGAWTIKHYEQWLLKQKRSDSSTLYDDLVTRYMSHTVADLLISENNVDLDITRDIRVTAAMKDTELFLRKRFTE